jgi:hypothetical protein
MCAGGGCDEFHMRQGLTESSPFFHAQKATYTVSTQNIEIFSAQKISTHLTWKTKAAASFSVPPLPVACK